MKKILTLIIASFLLLTGCGSSVTETMSCSYETANRNISAKTNYNVDYEGSEVKKVRVTYKYMQNENDDSSTYEQIDGINTGTDGTTDDQMVPDEDGIIDGIVGSAIDSIINGVTSTILDMAGIRDSHMNVQNTYSYMNGFSVENIDDTGNNYTVTYVIDYDEVTDDDISNLNLSRNIDELRSNYISQGFTCE